MTEEFRFERSGRQPKNVAITATAVSALVFAIVVIHIHPAIAAVFALLISPAIWDVISNTRSTLSLTKNKLKWRMGNRGHTFDLNEIERVNTKLSLDFSQKATIITKDGKKHRIPPPCLPPDGSLDGALQERGVAVQRSLF